MRDKASLLYRLSVCMHVSDNCVSASLGMNDCEATGTVNQRSINDVP